MNKHKNKILIVSIIVAILSVGAIVYTNLYSYSSDYKLYVNFLNDVSSKNVSSVYITSSPKIEVKLKDGKLYQTDNPRTNVFKEELLKGGIKVYEQSFITLTDLIPITTLVISVVMISFMLVRGSGFSSRKMLSVDYLDTKSIDEHELKFNDIAGNEEAKESALDIIEFLKNPEKFSAYGARMPKGIILYGEPGTGKTLMAKAVAGEAGVPFYAMSGSDFVQVYVGVGASRIRQLFKKAKSHGKAVIFIDEIDAIGKKRDNTKGGGSDERDQTLNALLTEMSGFNEKEGIIVMAATNRLDMLDDALLRPGRFDRHIEISLPDVSAREKILALYLKNKPTNNIDLKDWARKTSTFSGAKLESLVNEAAILACKQNSEFIENIHFDSAFSIVLAGHEKQNRDFIKESDRKITAYHEAGHALISSIVLPDEKVSKVTIIPSSKGAGGYTLSIPEDRMYQNKDYLRRRIMILLGGRAAEEIIFGKEMVTTGAYNDIQHSTNIVKNMITQYGMGETLGLLNLNKLSEFTTINFDAIISECKSTIDELYAETKELLISNSAKLDSLTDELLQRETLFEKDIYKLIS